MAMPASDADTAGSAPMRAHSAASPHSFLEALDGAGDLAFEKPENLHVNKSRARSEVVRQSRSGRHAFSYLEAAPNDFGECFAHRLRWAHAVNSSHRLHCALASAVHFLEADVSVGPLTSQACSVDVETVHALDEGRRAAAGDVSVRTKSGEPVIMAHYPTERSSDLSLERFIATVLQFNQRVLAKHASVGVLQISAATSGDRSLARVQENPSPIDEAFAFEADLNQELNNAATGHLLPACVGTRKGCRASGGMSRSVLRKGVKLDFKLWDSVEPTIKYLRHVGAAEKLGGHLWLNADVFAGPGALITPLDAWKFVRLCAENLPEAVLSLGWGSTLLSTTRRYTHEMIDSMIELCMCPLVRRSLPCREVLNVIGKSGSAAGNEHGSSALESTGHITEACNSKEGFCVAPVASCQHMTFAVMAEFALASVGPLQRLLDSVPGASLTIYSGVGSLGVTPSVVKDFLCAFGTGRCFFDLRVTRPWRSVIFGMRSSDDCQTESSTTEPREPLARSSCGPPSRVPHRMGSSNAAATSVGNSSVLGSGCRHGRFSSGMGSQLIAIV